LPTSAPLAFLRLRPAEPELQLLRRTFDNWHGLGLMTVGVERLGCRIEVSVLINSPYGIPQA
jgi:hypothetical protein